MLQKDRDRRYQTATEVSQALVELLPTAARDRVKVRRSLVSTLKKYAVRAGLVGCLAAVAFAAGALLVGRDPLPSESRLSGGAPGPPPLAPPPPPPGAPPPRGTWVPAGHPGGRAGPHPL